MTYLNCLLKSNILRIGPAKIMESCCHLYTDIPPMPWLHFILIDVYSFLVALSPSIEMCIGIEPCCIALVFWASCPFFRCTGFENIYCQSKLVFTIPGWCTESISTHTKIPHSFLICSTSIGTYHYQWCMELIGKCTREIEKGNFGITSDETSSSSFIDIGSTHIYKISWRIFSIEKRIRTTDKSIET